MSALPLAEQRRCSHSAASELHFSTAFPGLAQDPNHTLASECFGVALEQVMPQSDRCLGWGGRLDFDKIPIPGNTSLWPPVRVPSNV